MREIRVTAMFILNKILLIVSSDYSWIDRISRGFLTERDQL